MRYLTVSIIFVSCVFRRGKKVAFYSETSLRKHETLVLHVNNFFVFYVEIDPYQNLVITTTMNNISFKFPSTPILQTGYQPFQFCNIDNLPSKCRGNKDHENNNVTPYCECPQVVKLRKNDIVEMTIYDLIPCKY